MKNLAGYMLIAFVAFTLGSLYDSNRMANDEKYHDYWMERCKKSK